jgi:hypothetical protein
MAGLFRREMGDDYAAQETKTFCDAKSHETIC